MIFAQILHSFFFGMLSYCLYSRYNNGIVKPIYVSLLIIMFFCLLLYNYFVDGLSNRLFLFTLMFSISVIILQFMKKFITVFESNQELKKHKQLKENILATQNFIINKAFIVGLFLYQLLLIWFPEIFERILDNQ